MTLPKVRNKMDGMGMHTVFGMMGQPLQGDFEITTTLEFFPQRLEDRVRIGTAAQAAGHSKQPGRHCL